VELLPSTGVLKIYNVTYRPKEFHFHTPSEHQIFNYRQESNQATLWISLQDIIRVILQLNVDFG
jgi:hypothetical protein